MIFYARNKEPPLRPHRVQLPSRGANIKLRQHRTIPALRLKHRSGSCGTASALPKCSIMSGCGTRIVLRGRKPLALCDRCPCFGSLFPPLAALTFAASSIICAFGLAAAAPRSPYRHLELCGIVLGCILLLVTPCAGSGHRSPQCPHPGNRCGCRSDPPGQCPQWQRSAAWRRTVALPKHRAAPRIAGTHRNPPWC